MQEHQGRGRAKPRHRAPLPVRRRPTDAPARRLRPLFGARQAAPLALGAPLAAAVASLAALAAALAAAAAAEGCVSPAEQVGRPQPQRHRQQRSQAREWRRQGRARMAGVLIESRGRPFVSAARAPSQASVRSFQVARFHDSGWRLRVAWAYNGALLVGGLVWLAHSTEYIDVRARLRPVIFTPSLHNRW